MSERALEVTEADLDGCNMEDVKEALTRFQVLGHLRTVKQDLVKNTAKYSVQCLTAGTMVSLMDFFVSSTSLLTYSAFVKETI